MTHDETLDIVARILHSWPVGSVWTAEEMSAYAAGLERLDHDFAIEAVALAQQELKFRPSVAEMRSYHHAARLNANAKAKPVSDWTPTPKPPEWVQVWKWLRSQGDMRALPQQHPWAEPEMSQAEYDKAREAWMAAGSPTKSQAALVS